MGKLEVYRLHVILCTLVTKQLFKYFEKLAKERNSKFTDVQSFLQNDEILKRVKSVGTLTHCQISSISSPTFTNADCDVSLLCLLIQVLLGKSTYQERAIIDIRNIRNTVFHVSDPDRIGLAEFEKLWRDLSGAILTITKELKPTQDELDTVNNEIDTLKETPLPRDLDKWRRDVRTDLNQLVKGTTVAGGKVIYNAEKFNPIDRLKKRFFDAYNEQHFHVKGKNIKAYLPKMGKILHKHGHVILVGEKGRDLSGDLVAALLHDRHLVPDTGRVGLILMPEDIKYLASDSLDIVVIENPFGEIVFSKHNTKKFVRPLEILWKDVQKGSYKAILVTPSHIFENARPILNAKHPILAGDVFIHIELASGDPGFICVGPGDPDVEVTSAESKPSAYTANKPSPSALEAIRLVQSLKQETAGENRELAPDCQLTSETMKTNENDAEESERNELDNAVDGNKKYANKESKEQMQPEINCTIQWKCIILFCVIMVLCITISYMCEFHLYNHHTTLHGQCDSINTNGLCMPL